MTEPERFYFTAYVVIDAGSEDEANACFRALVGDEGDEYDLAENVAITSYAGRAANAEEIAEEALARAYVRTWGERPSDEWLKAHRAVSSGEAPNA